MTDATIIVGVAAYHPDLDHLREVILGFTRLGIRCVVHDNTPDEDERASIQASCADVGAEYVHLGENVGTAGALNQLVQVAGATGVGWVLYFDQDSTPSPDTLTRILRTATDAQADVAAIGCGVLHRGMAPEPSSPLAPARLLIASGTAYRVDAVSAVGGFDESFFLDLVDHEMCLRLRDAGYCLLRDPQRWIWHEIGSDSVPTLGGRIRITRHVWWRRRQMWRNTIVLGRRYGRTHPAEAGRLLLGRTVETAVAAIHFRELSFVSTAWSGLLDGIRAGRSRQDRREENR